jgi:hypothetical protein
MAFNHIHFNDQTNYGRTLRRMLSMMEESDDLIADVRDVIIQMRSGDGSSDSHYDEVADKFGVAAGGGDAANTKARALFEELDSAYSKTSGNGSVSNVRAARDQLFARLRG